MAGPRAKFDLRTAQRVAKATQWVEQQPRAFEGAGYGKPRTRFDGLRMVLVKQNGGSDGTYDAGTNTGTTAAWEYDLYDLADTGYLTKLNSDGTRQPLRSAARVTIGPVVQADDGSAGLAFFDADGAIQLWDCQETVDTEACS
jgi:hypothetical protein